MHQPSAVSRALAHSPRPVFRRMWLYPVLGIGGAALGLFALVYTFDHFVHGPIEQADVLSHYLHFDPDLIADALPGIAAAIIAVLGIVLTVIAIIVQLSSDRYTGVAMMFMRDRINISVLSYFVIVSVAALWLSLSLHADFVPTATITAVLVACSIGIAMMLPYFAYVFWFLEPGNIINRLRFNATRHAGRGMVAEVPQLVDREQEHFLKTMEEITDIANNSIDGRDKIIASRAVDALRDLALHYINAKQSIEHDWYHLSSSVRDNPDFVAMDPGVMHELEREGIWVEWKVLRQYLGIYGEALASMQDINHLIAINTRYIGEAAAKVDDKELLHMVFRFMNSYLRAAINAQNVRTAYNVLHQYRMLIESMLTLGQDAMAIAAVKYLKYYGHVSFDDDLEFITETIAYDLAALCEFAHRTGSPQQERILRQFLELDRPTRGHRQERGLRGVRKAQAKLATYYMAVGEEERARTIAMDMLAEPMDLLHSIRDELMVVETQHFWEVVDRGHNFEYLPPEQRQHLGEFFTWLDAAPPPRRRATDQ